jgi:hypothetical protein
MPHRARTAWELLEPIHAVTYFAPECREATKVLGLKGFWMGYFAARAAPMGEVGPEVVESAFYNFAPSLVRRAIPDAWQYATAAELMRVRASAAAMALRRIAPDTIEIAAAVVPTLRQAVQAARGDGLPLFDANRAVAPRTDTVEELWQLTTTLREHRGDWHVALLRDAGIDGIEAHVLAAAVKGISPTRLQESRGWTEDDWSAAAQRLRARGVDVDAYERLDDETDERALTAYTALSIGDLSMLFAHAERLVDAINVADMIPYPNPIGVPRFSRQ